jgi:quinol-cytochrome oxidoreductase complex cytochrome b subunit
VLRKPVPPAFRGYLAFGWMIVVLFALQLLTGVLLSLYYEPTPRAANESVRLIMRDVGSGWLIRGLHHWCATAIVVLALLQLLRAFVSASFRRSPTSWYLGSFLLLLVLAQAFTGRILPWDHDAYWSAAGALGLIESIPWVGPSLLSLLQGGAAVTDHTLSRVHSLHVMVFPWVGLVAVILNVWLLARQWARQREVER